MNGKEDWESGGFRDEQDSDNGNSYSWPGESMQENRGGSDFSYSNSADWTDDAEPSSEGQPDAGAGREASSVYQSKGRFRKKKKQGSTGKGILIGMLIVLIPLGLLLGAGIAFLKSSDSQLTVVSNRYLDSSSILSKLNLIQGRIDQLYLFDYDKEKLEDSIYENYVDGLGDPYTVYYTKDAFQDMMQSTQGTYYGIGVMITQAVDTGRITFVRVFSDSPAMEVGLQPGDMLLKVEEEEVTGMSLDEVVSKIKGGEGTYVNLTLYRESEDKEFSIDVERRQVDMDTVYSRMLDKETGYIELIEFDSVSTKQFEKALKDLYEQGMKSLVLDLRDNPGGLLDVAVDIADMLIDTGVVVSTADKDDKGQEYKATGEGKLGIPLVVLVNGNSASASEVLSGCIRDYKEGTLVGTQTFGKGIVQSIIPFTDGTAMKITTSHYYTPNGTDIHGTGITPDVVIEDDPETKDVDEQLEKALEILSGGKRKQ